MILVSAIEGFCELRQSSIGAGFRLVFVTAPQFQIGAAAGAEIVNGLAHLPRLVAFN